MRWLVAGAGGYIGLRLIPALLEAGHEVVALVRDKRRFPMHEFDDANGALRVIEGDLFKSETLPEDLGRIDGSYYLVHSLGAMADDLEALEAAVATNFAAWSGRLGFGRVVYLGGLGDDGDALSPHLRSRRRVETVLKSGRTPVTVIRASVIVGSGSASFEIIRDLAEKLPVMIAPRWLNSRCQPVAVRNVIEVLTELAMRPETVGRTYDLGGPQVMRYRDMLAGYAAARGLSRHIVTVPVLTPALSSFWLAMVTPVNFALARHLVESLRNDTVCRPERGLPEGFFTPITYDEAVRRALAVIAQNRVPSSWYDALSSGRLPAGALRRVHVPEHGVVRDRRTAPLKAVRETVLGEVWSLGGEAGWPAMNAAWRVRGFIDRLAGGTGMRRGRRHPTELRPGDALDFWRVLIADREQGRLVLLAEMRLPGEAWLSFEIDGERLVQTATFRPRGLAGRVYWWLMMPAHALLFPLMVRRLAAGRKAGAP